MSQSSREPESEQRPTLVSAADPTHEENLEDSTSSTTPSDDIAPLINARTSQKWYHSFYPSPLSKQIKTTDANNDNIFHRAMAAGSTIDLQAVLDIAISEPTAAAQALSAEGQEGKTPIGILFERLENGDENAKMMLETLAAAKPLFTKPYFGNNPLLQAIIKDEANGNTIFHQAATERNAALLQNAAPEILQTKNSDGKTPADIAFEQYTTAYLGPEVDPKLEEKKTFALALQNAPSSPTTKSTFNLLSEDNPDINLISKNAKELTQFALDNASDHREILEKLLDIANDPALGGSQAATQKALITTKDSDGDNIFHRAMAAGSTIDLQAVLDIAISVPTAAAQALTAKGQGDKTPIGILFERLESNDEGDANIAMTMLGKLAATKPLFTKPYFGNNPLLDAIPKDEANGNTIFHQAATGRNKALLQDAAPEILQTKNNAGKTPADIAFEQYTTAYLGPEVDPNLDEKKTFAQALQNAPSSPTTKSTFNLLSEDEPDINLISKNAKDLTNFALENASDHPEILEKLLDIASKPPPSIYEIVTRGSRQKALKRVAIQAIQKALKQEAVYHAAYSHMKPIEAQDRLNALLGEAAQPQQYEAYTKQKTIYQEAKVTSIQHDPVQFIKNASKVFVMPIPSNPPYPHQTYMRFAEKTQNAELMALYRDHPLQKRAEVSSNVQDMTPHRKISGIRSMSDFIAEAPIEQLIKPGVGFLYNSAQEVQYMARLIRSGAGAASTINLDKKRSIFSHYHAQDASSFYEGANKDTHDRYVSLTAFIGTLNIDPIKSAQDSKAAQGLAGTSIIFQRVIDRLIDDLNSEDFWGHLQTLAEIEGMGSLLQALPTIKDYPPADADREEFLNNLKTAIEEFNIDEVNRLAEVITRGNMEGVQAYLREDNLDGAYNEASSHKLRLISDKIDTLKGVKNAGFQTTDISTSLVNDPNKSITDQVVESVRTELLDAVPNLGDLESTLTRAQTLNNPSLISLIEATQKAVENVQSVGGNYSPTQQNYLTKAITAANSDIPEKKQVQLEGIHLLIQEEKYPQAQKTATELQFPNTAKAIGLIEGADKDIDKAALQRIKQVITDKKDADITASDIDKIREDIRIEINNVAIKNAIRPLEQDIATNKDNISSNTQSITQLEQALKNGFGIVRDSISLLRGRLDGLSESHTALDEQQKQLSKRLEMLAEDTTAQINTLGEKTGTQITEQQKALKDAGDRLTILSTDIGELQKRQGEIDAWRSKVGAWRSKVDEFKETQNSMNTELYGRLAYLTNHTESLSGNQQYLFGALDTLTSEVNSQNKALIEEQQQFFYDTRKYVIGQLKDIQQDLGVRDTKIQEDIGALAGRIEALGINPPEKQLQDIKDLYTSLERQVTSNTKAIQKLEGAYNGIMQDINSLRDSLNGLLESHTALDKKQKVLSDSLQTLAGNTRTIMEAMEQGENLIEDQQGALQNAQKSLTRLAQDIKELQTWKGEIQTWKENVGDLIKAQAKINQETKTSIIHLQEQKTELDHTPKSFSSALTVLASDQQRLSAALSILKRSPNENNNEALVIEQQAYFNRLNEDIVFNLGIIQEGLILYTGDFPTLNTQISSLQSQLIIYQSTDANQDAMRKLAESAQTQLLAIQGTARTELENVAQEAVVDTTDSRDLSKINIPDGDKTKSRYELFVQFTEVNDSATNLSVLQKSKVQNELQSENSKPDKTNFPSYFLAQAVKTLRQGEQINQEELNNIATVYAKDLGEIDSDQQLNLEEKTKGFNDFTNQVETKFTPELRERIIEAAYTAVTPKATASQTNTPHTSVVQGFNHATAATEGNQERRDSIEQDSEQLVSNIVSSVFSPQQNNTEERRSEADVAPSLNNVNTISSQVSVVAANFLGQINPAGSGLSEEEQLILAKQQIAKVFVSEKNYSDVNLADFIVSIKDQLPEGDDLRGLLDGIETDNNSEPIALFQAILIVLEKADANQMSDLTSSMIQALDTLQPAAEQDVSKSSWISMAISFLASINPSGPSGVDPDEEDNSSNNRPSMQR